MDDDDSDLLMYLVFGAAVLYFLYKNNVFGAPAAGSGGGALALPPASGSGAGTASGASAPVAAAANSAANQGPTAAVATPIEPDFGLSPGGWDD